jgi:hypothetical protein
MERQIRISGSLRRCEKEDTDAEKEEQYSRTMMRLVIPLTNTVSL